MWDQGHEDSELPVSCSDPLLQLSGTGRTKVADVDLLSETAYFMPRKISGSSLCKEKKQMTKAAVFSGLMGIKEHSTVGHFS